MCSLFTGKDLIFENEIQSICCIGTFDFFTGMTLAFVAYPAAIAKMPGSVVWAILFFLMLMMIGLGTMCISVHTVVTAIIDEYPRQLYKHRLKVLLAICVIMYLMGLPFLSQVSRNNLGFYFSKCRDLRLFR